MIMPAIAEYIKGLRGACAPSGFLVPGVVFALALDFVFDVLDGLSKVEDVVLGSHYGEPEPGHRHISHLFGLFPADQINPGNPEIYEAAKRTIARRIENGGGSTGWSRAWTICFYTRLKDGNNAYTHLKYLLKKCTANNLFDIHPPFQIDGNFGGVAGITEMLLQSHEGSLDERISELLPALPDEWANGSIKGIKARGNLTFDIEWNDGVLKNASITASDNTTLRIKLNDKTKNLKADKAFIIEDNCLKAEISAGKAITLTN